MRAVLDTNVLISGLLWRGAPHECLLSAEAGLYELILADGILDELREKLIHKFGNSTEEPAVQSRRGDPMPAQAIGLGGHSNEDQEAPTGNAVKHFMRLGFA